LVQALSNGFECLWVTLDAERKHGKIFSFRKRWDPDGLAAATPRRNRKNPALHYRDLKG
jgi:hypothetical protein